MRTIAESSREAAMVDMPSFLSCIPRLANYLAVYILSGHMNRNDHPNWRRYWWSFKEDITEC